MRPTANSHFSGAGGMDVGMVQAGVRIQQSMDLDPVATGAMRANRQYFDHDVITGDIKQVTVLEQPDSDIILGTYPCTKYSPIADIHGTRTGDDLFLHFFRHVAIRQPEMYIVENVPGMRKFPVVMEAMSKLPGYYMNIFCPLKACNWLPQKRDRLILIGTRRPFTIEQPTRERRPTIADIVEHGVQMDIPDYVQARINGKYRDKPIIVDADDPNALAPTCVAHYAKDLGTRMVKVDGIIRPFTVREYARLQGFPDDYHFEDKLSSYRLIGNAVAVPVGRWLGEQAMRYFN